MKVYNKPILTSIVLSANRVSAAFQVWEMYGFSIQAVYTGTPTGTFKLQGSADPISKNTGSPTQAPTNWTDIAGSSVAVTAAGDYMWNVSDAMYNFVRIVYTDGSSGSSSAVVSAVFNGKGV